jgi:hypothetical protein
MAYVCMLLGAVTMALMLMTAKLIKQTSRLSPLHLSVCEGMGLALNGYLYCKCSGRSDLSVRKPMSKYYLYRCVFGFFSATAELIAVFTLPFSMAVTLSCT